MTIQQIKQQLSILKVLRYYGLEVNKNSMVNCPFHADKKASMRIYASTNTAYCFAGSCSVNNIDQIDFILNIEKSTKHQAILKAKELIGIVPQSSSADFATSFPIAKQKLNMNIDFSIYQTAIKKSKAAQKYCQERMLDWKALGIGYKSTTSTDKWGRGCILFPLRNEQNQIVSLYGRAIKGKSHFYQTNRKGFYPKYPEAQTQTLVLCESIIDAASLTLCALPLDAYSILALFGTNGLTPEHLQAILNLKHLKEIVFALDGDPAGHKAVEELQNKLLQSLPNIKYSSILIPQGEDLNSLHQAHQDFDKMMKQLFLNRKALLIDSNKQQAPQLNTDNPNFITFLFPPLKFTLLGGINIQQLDRMRVTLLTELHPLLSPLHAFRQNIDLYNDDLIQKLIAKIAQRLQLPTPDIEIRIAHLIQAIAHYQKLQLDKQLQAGPQKRTLTPEQSQKAIQYLKAKNLLKRTSDDIGKTGIVGEERNRLLMYLCFTSRLQQNPLHILTLGSSGSGKTYLQENIAALFPENDIIQITASSDNAFYYIEDGNLKHKIILIEDLDGAEAVMYILRELMSKKMVSKLVTQKNTKGQLKTVRVEVFGPICLAATSTREAVYEDNANRSFIISPDNSPKQINDILNWQRKAAKGDIDLIEQKQTREFFKDIQSVLLPIQVRNPYAHLLRIPKLCFKPLRAQAQYLQLIQTITFYHQYQRPQLTDQQSGEKYIQTTLQDVEAANALIAPVLTRKSDEIKSKPCRDFLSQITKYLQKNKATTFKTQAVRQALRIHPSKIKRHLNQLLNFGYLKIVGGNRYNGGFEYQVIRQADYKTMQKHILDELQKNIDSIKKHQKNKK